MPRHPLPRATAHLSVAFTGENLLHLEALAEARLRTFQAVLFEELAFLRTYGLSQSAVRALTVDGQRHGQTLFQHVRFLIQDYAMVLPPEAPGPSARRPPSGRRTSVNVAVEDLEWLKRLGKDEGGLNPTRALNLGLDFCRTYLLPPDLLRALEAQAVRQGDSPRAAVLLHLWRTATALKRRAV